MKRIPRSRAKNSYQLLNELIKVVEDEPERLLMDDWIAAYKEPEILPLNGLQPECGTVACAAGWIRILRRPKTRGWRGNAGSVGDAALDQFPDDARGALHSLFYTFPTAQPGTPEYVAVVVNSIRSIQERFEDELKAFTLEPLK